MSSEEPQLSMRMAWAIVTVAIVGAALPHAFFAPPLQLHMEGQMQAWLGIAVWAPAILAGVGFFFGVEFGRRNEERAAEIQPATRASIVMIGLLGYALLAAVLHANRWTDMQSMRPWPALETALPLFAGLGALRAIFWQGFMQDRVLGEVRAPGRVALLCGLELIVAAPFLISGHADAVATGLLPLVAAEAVLGGLTFECGFSVRAAMLVRAVAGLAFVWFQQAMLL